MDYGKRLEILKSEKRNNVIPMYRAIEWFYSKYPYKIKSMREIGYITEEDRNLQNTGADTEIIFEDGLKQYWERKLSDQARSKEFDLGKKAICIAEYNKNGFGVSWGEYTKASDFICFGRHVYDSPETILYIFERESFFKKFWEIYNSINSNITISKDLLDYMIRNGIKRIEKSGYIKGLIDKISVNSYHKGHEGFCCNIYMEEWYRRCVEEWGILAGKFTTDKLVKEPDKPYISGTYISGE